MRLALVFLALLAVAAPAAAYDAPANVAAVRDGTTLTVTWEHSGDAKSFSVWQERDGAPNAIFSGSVVPADGRTSVFPVPSAAEVPQLCGIYVVARYLPEQPNMASAQVCATEAARPPPPGEPQAVTFRLTPPTHRVDETPLEPGDLTGHTIHYWGEGVDESFFVPMPDTAWTVQIPPGNYQAQAQAHDTEGNSSDVAPVPPLPVVVDAPPPPVDTVPPVITLVGQATQTVKIRAAYVEAGAVCGDAVDGSLPVTIDASAVNVAVLGDYPVTYSCTDAAGNTATEMRVVVVEKRARPKAPTITGE